MAPCLEHSCFSHSQLTSGGASCHSHRFSPQCLYSWYLPAQQSSAELSNQPVISCLGLGASCPASWVLGNSPPPPSFPSTFFSSSSMSPQSPPLQGHSSQTEQLLWSCGSYGVLLSFGTAISLPASTSSPEVSFISFSFSPSHYPWKIITNVLISLI